jgi:nucleotide-binding universal stress UspA family protein
MTGASDGIIAGYDGSPGAEHALRWAVREAKERGTALTICLTFAPQYLAVLGEPSVYDLARCKGEQVLAQGCKRAESLLGPGMVRSVLAQGQAAQVLCERSAGAKVTAVGSRGNGGLADLRTGSVASEVAACGHGPVVVVRGEWAVADHAPRPVAVGLDQSPGSQAAIAFAVQEARLHKVPLMAVCALADALGVLGGAERLEADFSHDMALLEKTHPDLSVLQQVAQGSPRTALLEAARKAQLLVVGCRGRGGVRGMNLGSVARAVMDCAPCPVAVIHQPGA